MRDYEKWREERKNRRKIERQTGSSHVWTGVLLLLIGSVALMRSYIPDFPNWVFTWQMLLISLGLFIGLRHKFHGAAWFILILVGGTFLVNDYFILGDLRRHIWPLILIAVGAFFIFRSRQSHRGSSWSSCNTDNPTTPGSPAGTPGTPLMEGTGSQDDYIDATSIFGGTKKNVLSKSFKGGDIVNVFGGTELNLTQADFNGTAELELTTIFGGTKLIVPSNWAVKSEAVTIFGGIEDKRQLPGAADLNTDKILLLRGTVIFGGIDIKSF